MNILPARPLTQPRPRPSVHEHPVVRIRFLNPEGQAHQSTFSSTWLDAPGHSGSQAGADDAESERYRLATQDAVQGFYDRLGCLVLSIELVSTSVLEVEL